MRVAFFAWLLVLVGAISIDVVPLDGGSGVSGFDARASIEDQEVRELQRAMRGIQEKLRRLESARQERAALELVSLGEEDAISASAPAPAKAEVAPAPAPVKTEPAPAPAKDKAAPAPAPVKAKAAPAPAKVDKSKAAPAPAPAPAPAVAKKAQSGWEQEVTKFNTMKSEMEKMADKYKKDQRENPADVNRWDTFMRSSMSFSLGSEKTVPVNFKSTLSANAKGSHPTGPWASMNKDLYRRVISSRKFLDFMCGNPTDAQCKQGGSPVQSGGAAGNGDDLQNDKKQCEACQLYKGKENCANECQMCIANPSPAQHSDFCVATETPGRSGVFTFAAYAKCKDKSKIPSYSAKSEQYKKWVQSCNAPITAATKTMKAAACKMVKKADAFLKNEAAPANSPHECIYSKNPGPQGDYKIVQTCAAHFGIKWHTCTCPSKTVGPDFECPSRFTFGQRKYACSNYCTNKAGQQAYQMMELDAGEAVPIGFKEARYKIPPLCRRWFVELENRWFTHWMKAKRDTSIALAAAECTTEEINQSREAAAPAPAPAPIKAKATPAPAPAPIKAKATPAPAPAPIKAKAAPAPAPASVPGKDKVAPAPAPASAEGKGEGKRKV